MCTSAANDVMCDSLPVRCGLWLIFYGRIHCSRLYLMRCPMMCYWYSALLRCSFNLYIFEFEMRRKQNRLNTLTCCTTSKRMKTIPIIYVCSECVFPVSRINATEFGFVFVFHPRCWIHFAKRWGAHCTRSNRFYHSISFRFPEICPPRKFERNKIAIRRDDRCGKFYF